MDLEVGGKWAMGAEYSQTPKRLYICAKNFRDCLLIITQYLLIRVVGHINQSKYMGSWYQGK